MDLEFILTLKSQGWLRWFCCPHCGSNFAISENGRCNVCDEYLMLKKGRSIVFENDIIKDAIDNSRILMPWEVGSSFYYHTQWIQWDNNLSLEIDNS